MRRLGGVSERVGSFVAAKDISVARFSGWWIALQHDRRQPQDRIPLVIHDVIVPEAFRKEIESDEHGPRQPYAGIDIEVRSLEKLVQARRSQILDRGVTPAKLRVNLSK